MKRVGLLLLALGIVAVVGAVAAGCGSLFSWNGRHPVGVVPLTAGTPLRSTFRAHAGRRYTLAVHVVFEREGLAESNGTVVVEAAFPLVVRLDDRPGASGASVVGWLNPNEPPNVLYGSLGDSHQRRPIGIEVAELVVERLVGPYQAAVDGDVPYVVDLGTDRVARARVKETRIVIYDDALPMSLKLAAGAAALGAALALTGVTLLFLTLFWPRRRRRNAWV